MPEPITLALLGLGKLFSVHAAHAATAQAVGGAVAGGATGAGVAHVTCTFLFTGVVVGTVLYAICKLLERLVNGGIFSQKQAEAFKEKAASADEKTREKMRDDAQALCNKWGVWSRTLLLEANDLHNRLFVESDSRGQMLSRFKMRAVVKLGRKAGKKPRMR
jgi:hypothetical protein